MALAGGHVKTLNASFSRGWECEDCVLHLSQLNGGSESRELSERGQELSFGRNRI